MKNKKKCKTYNPGEALFGNGLLGILGETGVAFPSNDFLWNNGDDVLLILWRDDGTGNKPLRELNNNQWISVIFF